MYDVMAIVVRKDMATGSFAKSFIDIDSNDNVLDSENIDLDFDAAVSKEKHVASSNAASAKRSQFKEVAVAFKVLNQDPVDADCPYEEVTKM